MKLKVYNLSNGGPYQPQKHILQIFNTIFQYINLRLGHTTFHLISHSHIVFKAIKTLLPIQIDLFVRLKTIGSFLVIARLWNKWGKRRINHDIAHSPSTFSLSHFLLKVLASFLKFSPVFMYPPASDILTYSWSWRAIEREGGKKTNYRNRHSISTHWCLMYLFLDDER